MQLKIYLFNLAAKPVHDDNEVLNTVVYSSLPLVILATMFLFVYWVYKRRKIPQFSHVSK